VKVIDARSGQEMKIGDTVRYGQGEYVKLLDTDPGLFSASATLEIGYLDPRSNTLTKIVRQSPLTVRWLHPSFLFQHVAFINS
jgi:hypothetical protein